MDILNYKAGSPIVHKGDKLTQIYMIQNGEVRMNMGHGDIKLSKNAIIGLMTEDWFLCDYIAMTDVSLVPITCPTSQELKKLLASKPTYRGAFLNTAVLQRHQVLTVYFSMNKKAKEFNALLNRLYDEYISFCAVNSLDEQPFSFDSFTPLTLEHKAEDWEVSNSNAIVSKYLTEYIKFMQRDDSLCTASILEAARQQRRIISGCFEMSAYFDMNRNLLLSENGTDLFYLYFEIAVRASRNGINITSLRGSLDEMCAYIRSCGLFSRELIEARLPRYESYDFESTQSGSLDSEMDIASEDCLQHILSFAGYELSKMQEITNLIEQYKALPDKMSTDSEVYGLRKKITNLFYEIYEKVFFNSVVPGMNVSPIIKMFLNFGFMDVSLAGKEHSYELFDLSSKLNLFRSDNVYTIYQWLVAIYRGQKEPSKNEFDLDYFESLLDRRKSGELRPEQVEEYKTNQEEKVRFEIQNLFASANKVTYGRITTFCPILNGEEMANSAMKMSVKAQDLADAFNYIRGIDYSVFYRDVMFQGDGLGMMENERMMEEVLPDVILLPNIGTRANLWQEISGKRSNTPGRLVFPIFTLSDLNDLMTEVCGRFRWELCRRIQGVHWNDIRDKSLTSEYCDYIQFYRKNRDLSSEGKEKIKTTLTQCRNNYREVFVRDYINWIKFESAGSFRINKVSRSILVRYCPFIKKIRGELKANPVYQNAFNKLEIEQTKAIQRFGTLYDRFEKAGGVVTEQMKANLIYFQM